jgi:hypothetical protein
MRAGRIQEILPHLSRKDAKKVKACNSLSDLLLWATTAKAWATT